MIKLSFIAKQCSMNSMKPKNKNSLKFADNLK